MHRICIFGRFFNDNTSKYTFNSCAFKIFLPPPNEFIIIYYVIYALPAFGALSRAIYIIQKWIYSIQHFTRFDLDFKVLLPRMRFHAGIICECVYSVWRRITHIVRNSWEALCGVTSWATWYTIDPHYIWCDICLVYLCFTCMHREHICTFSNEYKRFLIVKHRILSIKNP